MKKLLAIFLAILCLLTMLSIPALAADAGVEPYGTPGSGYDQKQFEFNGRPYTASNKTTFSTAVTYSSSIDVATGVNYIGGKATFNKNIITSGTLGFLS